MKKFMVLFLLACWTAPVAAQARKPVLGTKKPIISITMPGSQPSPSFSSTPPVPPNKNWNADVFVQQSIFVSDTGNWTRAQVNLLNGKLTAQSAEIVALKAAVDALKTPAPIETPKDTGPVFNPQTVAGMIDWEYLKREEFGTTGHSTGFQSTGNRFNNRSHYFSTPQIPFRGWDMTTDHLGINSLRLKVMPVR